MPKVHCINRKWLEQHKLKACLHQAERMRREVSSQASRDDKNNGASQASDCPKSKEALPPFDYSPDLVSLESTGHSAKRRRSTQSHDRKNASVIVTPQDESSAPHANEFSVISDTPAQSSRKRKMHSCDAISKAISIGIVPQDNDFIDNGTNTSGYQKVREWSNSRRDEYSLAQKKSTVLYEVLGLLRGVGGRVLQKKSYGEDEYWVELDDQKAIEKIRYYFFRKIHEDSPTVDHVLGSEVFPTDDSRTIQPSICIASEREDVSEVNPVSKRGDVTKIMNTMITVVESIAHNDKLSAHVDEEWLIEEKQVQKLLKEAFKVANITDDSTRWKTLQEHSDQIKASFICHETFRVWWNDFDSRTCRLPKVSIKVMTSFCRQQRMASYYRQDVAVLCPPGKLGLVLDTVTSRTPSAVVVGKLRISSAMANQICPGDRIVAIDDEDVSQMSVQEVSSIMAKKKDDDKVLVIKPSLVSTMGFTNSQTQIIPLSFQSNVEIMIFTYVKAHITSNRLRYNEVRVLLQLPPYILCETVGGKLCALRAKFGSNFDGAWSSVIPKVANWWVFVVDSKRHRIFDVSTLIKASFPTVSDSTTSSTLDSIGFSKIQEICECFKTYITTNEMLYNDVLDLLHLRPSSVLERIGRKLSELNNEMGSNIFGFALSRAKKHVLYWFVSTSESVFAKIDRNGAEHTLEAIVDDKVVRVKVTQNLSLECKLTRNRKKRIGPDDEHKIAQVMANAASLPHSTLIAIRKFIVNAELTALVLRLDGVKILANTMKAHSDYSNIQAEALLTLSQIVWSSPAASTQMVNEGCLQLAINAMERHVSHSKLQQMACGLFVALSYDKACCQAMLQSDVISSVLKSIRRRVKSKAREPGAKVLASGFLFLQNMAAISLDSVARAVFSESNILSTLLQTIQTNASNAKPSDLLISSFGLLSNLALHTDGNNRITDARGAEIIQDKLVTIKSAQLLKVALTTLLNLSLNAAVATTLSENGCAYAVISVARASKDNPDLLLISLSLLDKLIDTEVENAVASGAEAIALAAIGGHPSNNELCLVAISLLKKVSE